LDGRVGNKEWQFSDLHQIGQQKRVFSAYRDRIKQTPLHIHSRSSNRETRSVQIANAAIWLKQVTLQRHEAQFFCSPNDVRAISDKVQLKTVMLR